MTSAETAHREKFSAPERQLISLVSVTFNAECFLPGFLRSVFACELADHTLEVILVDNGSTDSTRALVKDEFPSVTLLVNRENNYAQALNLGIAAATGEYTVIANNDATVATGWLQGMLQVIQGNSRIGAVQSKIYFAQTGRLNSVGVEEIEQFYYRDIAFEAEDSRQYARPARRDFLSGGSVMFRRACLDDVGPWDERFVMFMEDIDYSLRCKSRGWRLMYSPDSVFHHQYHGSSSSELCDYFCDRNRFFLVAKHFPLELAQCIGSSHFFANGKYDLLFRSLLHSMPILLEQHAMDICLVVLADIRAALQKTFGTVCAQHFFFQLQLLLELRPMHIGVLVGQEATSSLPQHALREDLARLGQGAVLSLIAPAATGSAADRVVRLADNLGATVLGLPRASSDGAGWNESPPFDLFINYLGEGAPLRALCSLLISQRATSRSATGYDLHSDLTSPTDWAGILAQVQAHLIGRDELPSALDDLVTSVA